MRKKITYLTIFFAVHLMFGNTSLSQLHGTFFEENNGQFGQNVLFASSMNQYYLEVEKNKFRYYVNVEKECTANFEVVLLNTSDDLKIQASEKLSRKSNYLIGSNENHVKAVNHYKKLYYKNIYPNIDLKYYTKNGALKYDYVIKPGGNLENIKMKYSNVNKLSLSHNGDLIIHKDETDFIEEAPFTYQLINGVVKEVKTSYKIKNSIVYFEILENYDKSLPLIIDPTIAWSTWYTDVATGDGYLIDSAVDAAGNFYGTGRYNFNGLRSGNSKLVAGTPGASTSMSYVFKLNPSGTAVIWSTYIGGTGDDCGMAIEVDAIGQTYITGYTSSADMPTTASAYDNSLNQTNSGYEFDSFIQVLNSDGDALVYGSYLGGEWGENMAFKNYGEQVSPFTEGMPFKTGIEVSGTNVYIIGSTETDDLPKKVTSAASGYYYNLFIAKFDISQSGSNSLVATRTIGSPSDENDTFGGDIKLVGNNLYFVGTTCASDLSTTTGPTASASIGTNYSDGIIGKVSASDLTADFALRYQTGSYRVAARSIDSDATNNIFVVGDSRTNSAFSFASSFQTTKTACSTCHQIALTVYDNSLTFLRGTWYGQTGGSSDVEYGTDVILDGENNVTIGGWTTNSLPPTSLVNPIDATNSGGYEALVATFTNNLSTLNFGTYIGGDGNEYSTTINGTIGSDGWIGLTSHSSFSGTSGVVQQNRACGSCGGGEDEPFILRLTNLLLPIDLLYFNAQLTNNEVYLNWESASESDLAYFEIQHSTDFAKFHSVQKIAATNTATSSKYNFVHSNPSVGTNYYRLKIVELNGKIRYSNVAKVFNGNKNFEIISVYPQPLIGNRLYLDVFSENKAKVMLEIYDLYGKIHDIQSVEINGGIETIAVQTNNLSSGTYVVKSLNPLVPISEIIIKK